MTHSIRRTALGLAIALIGTSLAACGTGASRPEQEPSPSPTTRPGDLLITAADLPPGWRDSNSQGVGFRTTVCGVDLEPHPPVAATSIRFSQGPVGPFLEEHVRVYDDATPAEVVAGLRKALPTCTGYEAKGTDPDSPTAAFVVEPLTVEGAPASSVAWRQTSSGELPITSDIVLIDSGDATVALMSYVLRGTPDPDVLAAAVAAVPQG